MPYPLPRFARVLIPGLSLVLCVTACQATAASRPATLDISDHHTRDIVTSVLAKAINKARVELGPTTAPVTSVVTVLPPPLGPYETHSTAMPVTFDIESRDGRCVAVRRDTQDVYDLPGVACDPKP